MYVEVVFPLVYSIYKNMKWWNDCNEKYFSLLKFRLFLKHYTLRNNMSYYCDILTQMLVHNCGKKLHHIGTTPSIEVQMSREIQVIMV